MALKQIVVELLGDTRSLQKGMKRAEYGVNSVTGAVKKLAAALGIAFSARAVFRFFDQTIESTNVLIKSAKGLDFTVGQYQQLAFSLGQVGVEAGAAENAVVGFQRRLSKAVAGDKTSKKAFKLAGLDPQALAKMSPSAAFDAAFGKLAGNVGDPRAAGIFGGVFGNQASANMLKAARQFEDYKKSREAFARSVPTLSKAEEKAFEDVGDQVDILKAQWGGLRQKIVVDAIPDISKALTKLDESGALKEMAKALSDLIHLAGWLAEKFMQVRKAVEGNAFQPSDDMTRQERWTMWERNKKLAASGSGERWYPGRLAPMNMAHMDYLAKKGRPVEITQNNQFTVEGDAQYQKLQKAVRLANERSIRVTE